MFLAIDTCECVAGDYKPPSLRFCPFRQGAAAAVRELQLDFAIARGGRAADVDAECSARASRDRRLRLRLSAVIGPRRRRRAVGDNRTLYHPYSLFARSSETSAYCGVTVGLALQIRSLPRPAVA